MLYVMNAETQCLFYINNLDCFDYYTVDALPFLNLKLLLVHIMHLGKESPHLFLLFFFLGA